MANSFTQRVNNTFDTAIQIGKAKINLQGKIQFDNVLIRDHKSDTLAHIAEIKLNLTELENVLKGAYQFSLLDIIAPKMHITTYAGEEATNLKLFIDKLNGGQKKKQSLVASVGALRVHQGAVVFRNEEEIDRNIFSSIELALDNLAFVEKEFTASLKSMSFQSSQIEDLKNLSGNIRFTPTKIEFSALSLYSSLAQMQGALTLNYTDFTTEALRSSASIDLKIDSAVVATSLLKLPKEVNLPTTKISLKGSVRGGMNALKSNLEFTLPGKSFLKANVLLSRNSEGILRVQSKDISSAVTKNDFRSLLSSSFASDHALLQMPWERIKIKSTVDYLHGKELLADLALSVNKGTLHAKVAVEKTEENWLFKQSFDFSAINATDFIQKDLLLAASGNGSAEGKLNDKSIQELSFQLNLSDFEWNKIHLKNTVLSGKKNTLGFLLNGALNDEKVKLNFSFNQGGKSSKNFTVLTQLEQLNLSSFGWASLQSDVKIASNISVVGEGDRLRNLGVSNLIITNSQAKESFNDFTFEFMNNKTNNQIVLSGSEVMDFWLKGEFSYANIPLLLQSAVQEALLIPNKRKVRVPEFFVFDLALKDKLLKALYPDVLTPQDIRLNGTISSMTGQSFFQFDLPFIKFKGYNFESISLSTLGEDSDFLSRFSAGKIYGKNVRISKINLDTKNNDGVLSGSLSAKFGSVSKDSLGLEFTYSQLNDQSLFKINKSDLILGGEKWAIDLENNSSLSYDSGTNEFNLSKIGFNAKNQSVNASVKYRSKNNYSAQLTTNNLDLSKALPEGEKFNFGGRLSTQLDIIQSQDIKTASVDLSVNALSINTVSMGDFDLTIKGNPQFNSYQLTTSLVKEQLSMLVGTGTIFVPDDKPNLNLDFTLNGLDVSFLSSLGKDNVTNSTGNLTGELNLWGATTDLKLAGKAILNDSGMSIPSINTRYALEQGTEIFFRDRNIDFKNALLKEMASETTARLNGQLSHINFNAWEMDVELLTDRLLVYDRPEDPNALFYGQGYLAGKANFTGPTKSLTLEVIGSTSEGTTLVIPWKENKGLTDTSFIDFLSKGEKENEQITTEISSFDEAFRGFEMIFDLDINRNAEVEIVVDQSSGSTLSGRGSGNVLVETNIDGKFNIWGDFITYEGVYNFKNLGLIDKKFSVQQGGTIVWEGDPLDAQLNIEAVYEVPGGANPALLVDNPNFNRKIPTDVSIQLVGNLIKPDDPVFDISFPNTTGIVVSEINYRLADQQRRQLQAISLLSQGIFISDVSVSLQGITNNLYEKASDVFSTLIGSNEGKLNIGLNYLQGEETPSFDLRTEDRIGLTLTTQISDKILINGKIGVPIDGLQETVIVGDVQIDFILNESGTLKAKVFNRENEFRYLGDEFGYTQGMGMSYQVDFNTFKELIQKVKNKAQNQPNGASSQYDGKGIEFRNKIN